MVAAVAWDARTAQLAIIADDQAAYGDEEWRQLLFAGSALRHQIRADGPSAFGAPVVLAVVDDAGVRHLRGLAEDLAREYMLFSRVDLNLVPQVVEFEGFINYGSPIQSTSTNLLGQPVTNVITPNIINQPIFSARKVTTSVSVWDGQTVVLGGLMREDVQKTEDKTPILGDIPLVGRLFRSNSEQHLKRNLVIFVTARLINPGGQPVNQTEEEEETESYVVPPDLPAVPTYKK